MANSVLDGCGRYSEKLIEISKSIVEKRTINGEKTSENDIWTIDSQIFEAYQTILATAKDSNVIVKSIEYLKESVEKSGSISDINSLAISSVQKSIVEEQRYTEIKEETSKVVETVGTIAITTEIMKDGMKILDNAFDENTIKQIDSQIEKVQNGNVDAAVGMELYEKAMTFLAKNPILDEKSERGALGWLMRLEGVDSELAQAAMINMAKQYKFDILQETENGELHIFKENLDKLWEEKISVVNPKMAKNGKERFKELNRKCGDRIIEEGKFEGKTSEDYMDHIKNRVKNPQKAYLQELIEKYNKMQEKGASQEKLMDVQRKISVMNIIVKEKTLENSKEIDNFKNIVNKGQKDDEFVLE